jgi:hypothetical protein
MVLGVMCLQKNNDIGPEECKHLGPALAECKSLTSLDLVRDMDDLCGLCVMLGVLVPPLTNGVVYQDFCKFKIDDCNRDLVSANGAGKFFVEHPHTLFLVCEALRVERLFMVSFFVCVSTSLTVRLRGGGCSTKNFPAPFAETKSLLQSSILNLQKS